jgi:hypothetical protein
VRAVRDLGGGDGAAPARRHPALGLSVRIGVAGPTLLSSYRRGEGTIDEHDLDFEPDFEDEDEERPTFRATVASGRLTLNQWVPVLAQDGPVANHFPSRAAEGVTIADVTLICNSDAEPEAIVEFLTPGDHEAAEEALIAWARLAGHRRIWLERRVVETGAELPEVGTVEVKCPTCAARWEEHTHDFHVGVRFCGVFPTLCPLCGGTLPQWSLAHEAREGSRQGERRRARTRPSAPARRRG